MKYRVKNTTLKHNDQTYPEGSIVELNEEEAQELEEVLERVDEPTPLEDVKTEEKTKTKGGKN